MGKPLTVSDLENMNKMDEKLEMNKYRGSLSPFYNWVHKQEARENEYLQRALLYDTTELFKYDLKWRILHSMNFLIVHSGPQGSAKSSNAQSIGVDMTNFVLDLFDKQWADQKEKFIKDWGRLPKFDVTNICMTRPEFVERVQSSVPFETLIFDEDQPTNIGMGARLEAETESRFEKCLRSTQINMQFCSPSIEEHVANYYLEAYDKDLTRKMNRAIMYVKNRDGFLEPRSNVKLKYTYVEGYKEKKDKYNIRLKEIQEKDNIVIYDAVAKWVLENYVVFEEDEKGNIKQVMRNETIKSIIRKHFGERRFVESQLKTVCSQIDYIVNEERYRKDKYQEYQEKKLVKLEKLQAEKDAEKAKLELAKEEKRLHSQKAKKADDKKAGTPSTLERPEEKDLNADKGS